MVLLGSVLASLLVACASAAPVHSPAAGRVVPRKDASRTVRVAPLVRVQAKVGKQRRSSHDRGHGRDHDHDHAHEHVHSHEHVHAHEDVVVVARRSEHVHVHEHIHSHDVIDAPVVAMPPWDPSHSDHWNMRNGRVPVLVGRSEQLVAKTRKGNFDAKKQRVFGNVGGLVKRKTRKFAHAPLAVINLSRRDDRKSAGIPGFVEVATQLFHSSVAKSISGLVFSADPSTNGTDFNIGLSDTHSTQFSMVPIDPDSPNAFLSSDEIASAKVVQLRLPVLNSETMTSQDWCATFDIKPPSPMSLEPCAPPTTVPTTASQYFSYNGTSGELSPLYAASTTKPQSFIAGANTAASAGPTILRPLTNSLSVAAVGAPVDKPASASASSTPSASASSVVASSTAVASAAAPSSSASAAASPLDVSPDGGIALYFVPSEAYYKEPGSFMASAPAASSSASASASVAPSSSAAAAPSVSASAAPVTAALPAITSAPALPIAAPLPATDMASIAWPGVSAPAPAPSVAAVAPVAA